MLSPAPSIIDTRWFFMLSLTSAFPSLRYWWRVICCTDVSPKPLQGYFSSDFFQQMFPSPQVCVLSSPLSRNSAVRSTYCGASVPLWCRVHGRHSSDSSAPARLLGDTSPQQQDPLLPSWLVTTWAAQSSFLCCLK